MQVHIPYYERNPWKWPYALTRIEYKYPRFLDSRNFHGGYSTHPEIECELGRRAGLWLDRQNDMPNRDIWFDVLIAKAS